MGGRGGKTNKTKTEMGQAGISLLVEELLGLRQRYGTVQEWEEGQDKQCLT